jgi:hypothetical protein
METVLNERRWIPYNDEDIRMLSVSGMGIEL